MEEMIPSLIHILHKTNCEKPKTFMMKKRPTFGGIDYSKQQVDQTHFTFQ